MIGKFLHKHTFIFLLFLTLTSGIISISPVITQPTSPYFVIDPDPTYVANAVEYLQIHKIFMSDHPGTPLVIYLSIIFTPIKYFEKLIGTPSFTQWAVEHFMFLMWVGKFSVFTLFLVGLYIFHLSIFKLFKSYLANIFLTLLLFLIPHFMGFQGMVTPENIGFFFLSVWFYFVVRFLLTKRTEFLSLASVFVGLAVASKFVFIFASICTLLVTLEHIFERKNRKEAIYRTLVNGVVMFAAFMMGIIPIMSQWGRIFYWAFYLLTTVGVPGTGGTGFVSPSIFWSSFLNWFGGEHIIFIGFILLALSSLNTKVNIFWKGLFTVSIIGLLIFMKYPDDHYQYANILLLTFCFVYLLTLLSDKAKVFILLLTIPFSFMAIRSNYLSRRDGILNAVSIQNFVSSLPPNGFYIWQDAASEDFALVRGLDWSNMFYKEELKKYRPNLWVLWYQDFGVIVNNDLQKYSIDDFCWDGLFLNKLSWNDFISKQKNPTNYNKVTIDGSEDLFVTRKFCSKENLHPKALDY